MIIETFKRLYEGFQWYYKNDKGDTLSVICHKGSYGFSNGEFETQCSWLNDVQGHLSFGQVQRKIDTLKKRELRK